jgi:hypothetical protein
VVHTDSSLVRTDLSWEAIGPVRADAVEAANGPFKPQPEPACRTDPDASLATSNRTRRVEPAYKQYKAVDATGMVLDVAVTTGAQHDSKRSTENSTPSVRRPKCPSGWTRIAPSSASSPRSRRIGAVIPAKAERPSKRGTIPVRRFELNAKLGSSAARPGGDCRPHGLPDSNGFEHYRAGLPDCEPCRLRAICFSTTMGDAPSYCTRIIPPCCALAASMPAGNWRTLYRRHRGLLEGVHGDAKTWHGLARAIRLVLVDMPIQAFSPLPLSTLSGRQRLS